MSIAKRAHLMLCGYATRTDNLLTVVNGGLRDMPWDAPWFLAGTVDLEKGDVVHGGDIWVSSATGEEVPGTRLHINVDASGEPDEGPMRLFVALELPQFELAPNEDFALEFELGDVSTSVRFQTESAPPAGTP